MNYLLTFAYQGQAFYGFERQKGKRTVQGEFERALTALMGEEIHIHGAGRTDAGVHALAQRANFHAERSIEKVSFLYALNRLLPPDIFVKEVEEVPKAFDARHNAKKKRYIYQFRYGDRDPFQNGLVGQYTYPHFDEDAFRDALSCFQGTHNFQNFTSKAEDPHGFVRTIDEVEVRIDQKKKEGTVSFLGNGFMTYMVRLMMGAALRAAAGKWGKEDIQARLNEEKRHIFSLKAPAGGLYLAEVFYE